MQLSSFQLLTSLEACSIITQCPAFMYKTSLVKKSWAFCQSLLLSKVRSAELRKTVSGTRPYKNNTSWPKLSKLYCWRRPTARRQLAAVHVVTDKVNVNTSGCSVSLPMQVASNTKICFHRAAFAQLVMAELTEMVSTTCLDPSIQLNEVNELAQCHDWNAFHQSVPD